MTVEELRDRRHTLARECRAMLDRATAESRGLTQEERDGVDRRDNEISDLDRRMTAAGAVAQLAERGELELERNSPRAWDNRVRLLVLTYRRCTACGCGKDEAQWQRCLCSTT